MKGHVELGSTQPLFDANLNGLQVKAVIAAVVGIAVMVLGALSNRSQFFISYLSAYLFWGGMGLGFMLLLMLHNSTGGKWGRPIRSYLEAGSRTVPVMAFFFLPIFFGIPFLYSWTRPEVQAELEGWETKGQYLNVHSWTIRAVAFFAIWIIYVFLMKRWNTPKARLGEEEHGRLQTLSSFGLLLYFTTFSFMAIDWYMSLEPAWFSSIFGVILIVGQGGGAFAFMVFFTYFVARDQAKKVVPTPQLHDLGNFMLMSVMLWAYTSFSQYLIIWSAQLPEETSWLIHRSQGIWGWVGFAMIVIHFFVPFFFLLFRPVKKNFKPLFFVAGLILLVHMVHDIWVVAPAFRAGGPMIHWLDVGTFLGLGGVWTSLFIGQLKSIGPVGVPIHDGSLPENKISSSRGNALPENAPSDRPVNEKPGQWKPAGA